MSELNFFLFFYKVSLCVAGLIGSMFSFLQFLAAPLMGAASDVYGRKPLMILSAVSTCLLCGLIIGHYLHVM